MFWREPLLDRGGPAMSNNATTTDNRHSPDFRSVVWQGEPFTFTASQAAVVALLWRAWSNGTPDVGGGFLLDATDSEMQGIAEQALRTAIDAAKGHHAAQG